MRLTRYQTVALGVLVLAVFGPVAFTQPDMGRGKGGRGGFKQPTPEETFAQYSGGKNVITVNEVQVPERMARFVSSEQLRERMNAYLQKKGITNGQMTLEQFKDYTEESRREMMERFQKGDFGNLKFSLGGGKQDGDSTQKKEGGSATPAPADNDARMREYFNRLDSDKDGSLSAEELQAAGRSGSRLYEDRAKYDKNSDGKIDLNEFLEYVKDRSARGGGKGDKGGKGGQGGFGGFEGDDEKPKVEEVKKPVVYRAGNLPKELAQAAPWFEECDKDRDGQVGLYEWKAAGREVKEFLALDTNGDGFVTVEELLRYQKAVAKKDESKGTASLPGAGTPTPSWGNRGGWGADKGGKGGGWGNRGGWGADKGGKGGKGNRGGWGNFGNR